MNNPRFVRIIPACFAGMAGGLLVLLIFGFLGGEGHLLFCTDNNVGNNALVKALLPHAFYAGWLDNCLVGSPMQVPMSLTFLLDYLLPPVCYTSWIVAIYLMGASLFLALFLKGQKVAWPAVFIGVITYCWLGCNFTMVYPGHTSKFGILFLTPLYLYLCQLASARRSIAWWLLVGSAMGLIFVEQPDVGLFVAIFIGLYTVFSLVRVGGWHVLMLGRGLLPVFVGCLLLALNPLLTGYSTSVKDVVQVSDKHPAAKWEYVTQWSLVPDESIAFIAPGYMGWRSGEPEGPYWGRLGRSADWEKTAQGFMNFKLDDLYIGAIPVILALLAVLALIVDKNTARSEPQRRSEIRFWGCVAMVTLMLSFGKYFPLYSLFYHLPVVGNIRNPVKFLQVFQLAVGVLAAYGFDMILGVRRTGSGRISLPHT